MASLSQTDVDDILADAQRLRHGSSQHRITGPYYASQIMEPDLRGPSPQPQRQRQRHASSWASSATRRSRVFDDSDSPSAYSALTVPSRHGPVAPHRQRPLVPDAQAAWPERAATPWRPALDTASPRLPCEFRVWSSCAARFALDQVEAWIDHAAVQHLDGLYPATSICWFCDEVSFTAPSRRRVDRSLAYRERMHHIAGHFRDGMTAAGMRPDFYFLDHVYDCGLIDEAAFERARQESEPMPMPRDTVFGTRLARGGRSGMRLHGCQGRRRRRPGRPGS